VVNMWDSEMGGGCGQTLNPAQHENPYTLSSGDVFQETSARYRAVEPEQWLQRHPEAGSSWPSWHEAPHSPSSTFRCRARREQLERSQRWLPGKWVKPGPESGIDCLMCALTVSCVHLPAGAGIAGHGQVGRRDQGSPPKPPWPYLRLIYLCITQLLACEY